MGLGAYRAKRKFNRTAEPKGKLGGGGGRLYVVQKHDASRLHYDFRLELDGALKSWAVPKGPSLDPAQKRLAVHVEDHPIEYGAFEGTIPKGEYGGGTVMLWDRGKWKPIGNPEAGYKKGSLKFELHGEKLKGRWALVRMGGKAGADGKNWLLIKEADKSASARTDILKSKPRSVKTRRTLDEIGAEEPPLRVRTDKRKIRRNGAKEKPRIKNEKEAEIDPSALPGARKGVLPKEFSPQLATLVTEPPRGEGWGHEIKFDGYRALAFISNGKPRIVTRNGKDWTRKFGPLLEPLTELNLKHSILDGEIVILGPEGATSFQALQNYLNNGGNGSLTYYLFDLPFCNGFDLRHVPLAKRKALLRRIMENTIGLNDPRIRFSEHIHGQGEDVYSHACRLALEGVVSKKLDSPYEQRRTRNWLKVKCSKRQEFVIGGFTDPSGSRAGFGALLLGHHNKGNFTYCGRVGTGFDAALLKSLRQRMSKLERSEPAFVNPPRGREAKGVHWVKPGLVAVIAFSEKTDDGMLRHPSFQGLRADKSVSDVGLEESAPPAKKSSARWKKADSGAAEVAGIKISHPDRVLYPDQGLTKLALAEFYAEIAPWILPHVAHRPLSIVRCPRGQKGECFYQKHFTDSMPEGVRGVPIADGAGKHEYLFIDDARGLISLVQLGVLELHPWGCKEDKIERPDVIVFDLDPGPGVSWKSVIEAAIRLRGLLDKMGLTSFIKTSGGKGLHISVPIERRADWDETKAFAKFVANQMASRWPKDYVATMSKAKRAGKIYVDYLRNSRGATSIAPYSTRARSGAPVSMPLNWDRLSSISGPAHFNVANGLNCLKGQKRDPWKNFYKIRQRIPSAR